MGAASEPEEWKCVLFDPLVDRLGSGGQGKGKEEVIRRVHTLEHQDNEHTILLNTKITSTHVAVPSTQSGHGTGMQYIRIRSQYIGDMGNIHEDTERECSIIDCGK